MRGAAVRRLVERRRRVEQQRVAVGWWWTDRVGRRGPAPPIGYVCKSVNSVTKRILYFYIIIGKQYDPIPRTSVSFGAHDEIVS